MSESKTFIKNAVGVLIVVAICLVAVTIYKKGNVSISNSISDYDELVSQFNNVKLTMYENATTSGAQIIELLKSLEEEDEVTVVVANGYSVKNEETPQKYTYESIHSGEAATMAEVTNKNNKTQYIQMPSFFLTLFMMRIMKYLL